MTNTAELAKLRTQFPITQQGIYFDHAAVGPFSRRVEAAVREHVRLHCEQLPTVRPIYEQVYRRTRTTSAELVGSTPERIAFVQNTSHGLSLIANGHTWRRGDNVVVPALDFPSNFLPWLRLEKLGVEFRRVEAADGKITPDRIAPYVDDRTRIIALSAVQYFNGFRVDLPAMAELAHSKDALLVVDGTQAVGAVCLDVARSGVDALVVSAHKWMLGPLGIGFMALSDRAMERIEVTQVGWLSVTDPFAFRRELKFPDTAERFEPGTENGAGLFGLDARLSEIAEFGKQKIEQRLLNLTASLAERLSRIGFAITSTMGADERSGILTFRHNALSSEETVAQLREQRTYLSARHGSLRASPHYYNSEGEIEALVSQLQDLL
jgi:selenocysteine lyase/cysteine desulfurase